MAKLDLEQIIKSGVEKALNKPIMNGKSITQWAAIGMTAPQWVSVEERMPEEQTPVLVYVPPYSDEDEEYIGHVAMAYYTHSARGGYWAGTDGNVYGAIGIIHEPSHWMPLPEPPKLEGGENDA
jgi:hypothetical protein